MSNPPHTQEAFIRYRTGASLAGPSIESQVLYQVFRWFVRPVVKVATINQAALRRAALLDVAAGVRNTKGVSRTQVSLPGFDAEIVRAPGVSPDLGRGVIMYMHGGGFMCCGLNTHRPVVAALAKLTGLPVMNVGYRQLPDTDIGGSIADCLVAYRWLLENGARPDGTVFAGDSAGGFLVFATALKAVEENLPGPAGLVGFSPFLDLDCSAKAAHVNAERDAFATVDQLEAVALLGAQKDGELDTSLSPVNGNLATLPPTLLFAAESEVLRCDSELMASRLHAAGVPCHLQIWDGQVHAFPAVIPAMPESRVVLRAVARFVLTHTSPNDGSRRKTA